MASSLQDGRSTLYSFQAEVLKRMRTEPQATAAIQSSGRYFVEELRNKTVADSVNSFTSGAADSEALRRVLSKFAANHGCRLGSSDDGVYLSSEKILPPLNDVRIWGFDTDDFGPFNSTLNLEQYSTFLLGVGYDNVMQCFSLRSQVPAVSKLETMAMFEKDQQNKALIQQRLLQQQQLHHQRMQQHPMGQQFPMGQPHMGQASIPLSQLHSTYSHQLASLKQPPFSS